MPDAPTWDLRIENVHAATMDPARSGHGAVRDASILVRDGAVAWVGARAEAPAGAARRTLDGEGGWVTPGLVDCHTHLVFGGTRVAEFEERLRGASYEDLARRGGGILSTVRATRAASDDALEAGAIHRLRTLAQQGVTALEIKSGYGLDLDTELRMLRVARRAAAVVGVRVRTTLLAAHAVPPEWADDRDGYVRLVCEEMIPRAAAEDLADAVDCFCESIAFTAEECGRVLAAGARHGLARRVHADQRTDSGGAALAAECGAASADHLEHTSEEGVRAMAAAGTAAVLLPGAAYTLRDPTVPPVDAFRRHGVPMAVATDLNPGSSPLRSPLLAMNMACTLFGLTPDEALLGMTRVAAGILGLEGGGTIRAGVPADLVIWDIEQPAELCYWMGGNPCRVVVRGGVPDTPGDAG
ncbi:MAG: imidazolonepropionase [Longimicrobiales bacterium]